jgi:hypothetical protein
MSSAGFCFVEERSVIDSISIQTTAGKRRMKTGIITVDTPDDSDDVLVTARDECGDERSLYMRIDEARLLARVLLQVTEDE